MNSTHLRYLVLAGIVLLSVALTIRLLYRPKATTPRPPPSPEMVALDSEYQKAQAEITANPDNTSARWRIADIFQKVGRLDKAAEAVFEIQRRDPKSVAAVIALGNIALAQGDYAKAVKQFDACASKWPRSVEAWQGLSTAEFHQKHYWEAAESARQAIKLNIDDPNSRLMRASALLYYALEFPDPKQRELELRESRATLKRLLGYWADRGELFLMAGKASFALDEKADSIKYLRRAEELLPKNADAALYAARAYYKNGNLDKARGILEAALSRNVESAPIYDLLGQLIGLQAPPGFERKALDYAQKAVRLEPNDARYRQKLGTAYLRVNDLAGARAEFEQATRLDPEQPFAHQQLAAIYTRMGEPDRATASARMATQMTFNRSQLREIQYSVLRHPNSVGLHLILGDRYRDLKKYDASRDEYRRVLKLDPKNARAKEGLIALDRTTLTQQVAR